MVSDWTRLGRRIAELCTAPPVREAGHWTERATGESVAEPREAGVASLPTLPLPPPPPLQAARRRVRERGRRRVRRRFMG